MTTSEKSYLIGRAKRWFWPATVVLCLMMLWSVISAELYPALLDRVVIEDNTAFLIAGILTFLHTGALITIMAVYGMRNKVKIFRLMFFVLGGLYLLSAFGHYISNYYVSYILQFHGRLTPAMSYIAEIVSLLVQAAWIVFAVIVIFHRRTGGVLRASAIVMLIAQLAMVAYRYSYSAIYEWLSLQYDMQAVYAMTWLIGFVMVLATYVPIVFLLGAMSFSRMKKVSEPEEVAFPQV